VTVPARHGHRRPSDDCWFDPQRDSAGNLRANPTKFPSGMKALGDYIHSKGHEAQDAATFASWGVNGTPVIWPCNGQNDQKWTTLP
jgi:alpha-galactosidase